MSFQEDALRGGEGGVLRGRRAALVGIVVVAIAVFAVGSWAVFSSLSGGSVEIERVDTAAEQGEEGAEAGSSANGEGAVPDGQGAAPASVVVHVSGAVANPGVYELPEGSRAGAAVDAAGGFTDEAVTGALNLARVVADGEQLAVPSKDDAAGFGAEGSVAAGGSAPSASQAAKVNINTATVAELDALPGVGESTARKIVAEREANGPFTSPEDLMRVSGIGEKKFEQMADQVIV